MYIYLRTYCSIYTINCTSKTLFYYISKGKIYRIWKPAFESPYIDTTVNKGNWLKNFHSGYIQIQRIHTTQTRSRLSGLDQSISVRKYRGQLGGHSISHYGIYRYRLVKDGKKAQWRTISIMNHPGVDVDWDLLSIK